MRLGFNTKVAEVEPGRMLKSDYQLLQTQDSQAHRRYDLLVVRQRQPKKRGGTHGTPLLFDALLIRKLGGGN
jgi:hypothetical protein